jgi:hypothetical protein
MKKGTGTIKWSILGVSIALLVASLMYFSIPANEVIETRTVSAEEGQYSRTLYGVPDVKLEHYRISEEKYFDYLVSGVVDVGRENPSLFPLWYVSIIDNPALLLNNPGLTAKILSILEKGSVENSEIAKSLDELLSNSETVEEAEEAIKVLLSVEQVEELKRLLIEAGQYLNISEEEVADEEKAVEDNEKIIDEKLTEEDSVEEKPDSAEDTQTGDTAVDNSTDSKKDSEEVKSEATESTNE